MASAIEPILLTTSVTSRLIFSQCIFPSSSSSSCPNIWAVSVQSVGAVWIELVHSERNSWHFHIYFSIFLLPIFYAFSHLPLNWQELLPSLSHEFGLEICVFDIPLEVILSVSARGALMLCPELTGPSAPRPPSRDPGEPARSPGWHSLPPGHRGDRRCLRHPWRGHRSERGWRHLRPAPFGDVLLDLSGREYTLGGPHQCGRPLSSVLGQSGWKAAGGGAGVGSGRWWAEQDASQVLVGPRPGRFGNRGLNESGC